MTRSEQKQANRQQHWLEQFQRAAREAMARGVTPEELARALDAVTKDSK